MAATSSAPRQVGASARPQRANRWLTRLVLTLLLMGCDALSVNAAMIGVYRWRWSENRDLQEALAATLTVAPATALVALILINLIFTVTFTTSGLYTLKRGASRIDEIFKLVVAVTLGMFAWLIVNTLLPQVGGDDLPLNDPLLIPGVWAAVVVASSILRFGYRLLLTMLRQRGIDTRRLLIVGAREPGRVVLGTIRRTPRLGYNVVGFLSDTVKVGQVVDGLPVLGRPESLGRVVRATRADEVIIALSGRSSDEVLDIVALAEDESVEIKLYPDAFQLVTNNEVSVGDVSGLPLLGVKNVALDNPLNQALKRALDVVFSSMVMIFFSPIMLLIALLIKLDSPGPVFFVQERVGLDGKPFAMIKFRGMRQDAPDLGTWTTRDDPRVTRLGAFLRRYSLDELPQFINVLRGEMSVVGPRPEQRVWVERFSQDIPRYMRRHKLKAGITGWAQVNGLRGDTSIAERTRYDLYYVDYWSLLFDIKIILQTTANVLFSRNRGY